MSHSPKALQDKDVLAKYQNGWQETSRMLREGKSFSGHERNCAYLNVNGSSFANVSAVTGLDFPDDGRAVCVTDWDQDGDLDLWFHNRTGPRLRLMRNRLMENSLGRDTHFVAFRLRGTESNRDAIGARLTVRLAGAEKTLIQTLHAGDAFLSQSSKWLHFGLGSSTEINRVIVRWPNGQEQQFGDVPADQRYLLTEGQTTADLISSPRGELKLAATTQPEPAIDSGVRTVLSNRLPLPILPYKSIDGEQRTIELPKSGSAAKLVVLVASWCPACREELVAFKEKADTLAQTNVEVLIVALDGLDVEQSSGGAEVRQFAKGLGLPFPVGIAESTLLEKLDLAQRVLFNRSPQTAVPLNLLIDADGALATIYRGPVDVDTLIADVGTLNRTPSERRDSSVPFAGTWTSPPRQMLMRAVGHLFAENGFEEDRLRYLQLDTEMLERQRRLASSPEQRKQLDAMYADENYKVGAALLAKSESEQAAEYFERAVAVNPSHVNALVNLAMHYAKSRKPNDAIALLQRAIAVEPDSVVARVNLGNTLSSAGKFSEAAKHYSHIVMLGKATAAEHSRLARAYLETGQIAKGVESLENAIQKGAVDAGTLVSLAWIKATSPDDSLRDGDRAVELGSLILAKRLGSPVLAFDVVGAAHAEQGDFAQAVASAKKAIALMGGQKSELREQIEQRIAAYSKKVPHRDKDGKYP